jgi:hypothetical protein
MTIKTFSAVRSLSVRIATIKLGRHIPVLAELDAQLQRSDMQSKPMSYFIPIAQDNEQPKE